MTKALVTGATGFTGSHLVRRLLDRGTAVRVIARSATRARLLFGDAVEIVEGDVTERAIAARGVPGCDVVFHLAAAYREAGLSDRRNWEVHVLSTRNLIEAAHGAGIRRFVHCSTVGVLGHIQHPPADETTPPNPGDVYQATKWEAEQLALALAHTHDLPITVARPAAIYGPGDLRFLKLFRSIARRRFAMIGTGRVFYHLVYVSDLIDGLLLLAERDAAVGEVFILAGAEYQTLNDMIARIAAHVGVPPPRWHVPLAPVQWAGSACEWICKPLGIAPPIYRRRVDFFAKSRAFSIEKAHRVLGYAPVVDVETGLARTTAWYRAEGHLPPAPASDPR